MAVQAPSGEPLPQLDLLWGRQVSRARMSLLIAHRKSVKLPASQIATRMGVQPEVIYRLELEDRDPRLSTVLRYAHCLGLDVDFKELVA